MDFFWSNVFDYFKDRRVAAIFITALAALGGILIAGSILFQALGPEDFQRFLNYSLPVVGLGVVVWLGRSIAQARARWRNRYRTSPMSRDELNKARSKLMTVKR